VESGSRKPPAGLPRRLDEVLGTGGELSALWIASIAPPRPRAPLPGEDEGVTAVRGAEFAAVSEPAVDAPRTQLALAGRAWPTRLPVYGLMCPLHGGDGCVLPGPEAALAAYLSVSQESGPAPSGTESETVHGLTALLAAHAQAGTELTSTSIVAPVEKVLRAIVRWAETVPDVPPHAPF